jgi:ribonuclease ZC3H12
MISAINATTGTWNEEKPLRRLLESEDSSYDSDYENNDSEQSANSSVPAHHDEVSRTISDTLGQEFDEYVTTSPLPQQTLLDVIINDPNYTSRVEFALKLGYTETQVQIALMKLGPNAGQNELLAELIKLGAGGNNTITVFSGLGKTLVSSFINDNSNGDQILFGHNNDSPNLRPIVIDGSNVAIRYSFFLNLYLSLIYY